MNNRLIHALVLSFKTILVLERSTSDLKELELKEIGLDEVLASKLDASQFN